ncbi:MAG: hypothetical protein PUA88_06255 [Bacillales bacterium]|nr:hypothetical protein [Erysipelotrichaceae bacterium]MDD6250612.1 hypothetical protein [Bacillales bacterium]MDD7381228.1 hypothetical protein [Bacillales bacterium]MDY3890697.1 hypothetical protein [Bacilli bacterium]MDY6141390.1 hypothetical protein [Bacilli bacterium]
MKIKRSKMINYSVISFIFMMFSLYLLLKYKDNNVKFISASILLIIASLFFILFIYKSIRLSFIISKDEKNRKKFLQEISKSKNSMFISFTDDVLEGNFEKELRKNIFIKEKIMSYIVEIGYDRDKKPALFIRLFLMSKNVLSLYCNEKQLALALVSLDMKIMMENTILYEDSYSLVDLEEKIIDNVDDFVRK